MAAALQLAAIVRKAGLPTASALTAFDGCDPRAKECPRQVSGNPLKGYVMLYKPDHCRGACTFVLLAGKALGMLELELWSASDFASQASPDAERMIKAYLSSLPIGAAILREMEPMLPDMPREFDKLWLDEHLQPAKLSWPDVVDNARFCDGSNGITYCHTRQ